MRRQKINWFYVRVVFGGFPSLSGGRLRITREGAGLQSALLPQVPPGLRVHAAGGWGPDGKVWPLGWSHLHAFDCVPQFP